MSLLTVVRHGQASYMSQDYDKLSPLGEEQARKLGLFWAQHRITFDQVFHGPAKRHIRTMEIAAEQLRAAGLPWPEPILLAEFDEFDAYTMMKTMVPALVKRDEAVRNLSRQFEENQQNPEAGRMLQALFEAVCLQWCAWEDETPDLETWAQFRARIAKAVDTIRESSKKSSSVAVFTSGGPIAATVGYVLDLPPRKTIELVWASRNGSYSEFLFSGTRFSLSSFNSFPHIDAKGLLTYR